MTRLDSRKSQLKFITSDCIREQGKLREVIIEGNPFYCTVRLKGLRKGFDISWAGIYNQAIQKHVERQRAERKKK